MIVEAPDRAEFRALIESAMRELMSVDHRGSGSYVRLPLMYPSGSTVVVRVRDDGARYFVSDFGLGYQEADMMGAGNIYTRHARVIANAAGVGFDTESFFVLEASRDQLPGAVMTVANCSKDAVALSAYRLSERRITDAGDRLYDRLSSIFRPTFVERQAEIVGSSNVKWHVANLVKPNVGKKFAVFDVVANHHTSITYVASKFNDLKLLEKPPNRVVVTKKKEELGDFLGLLTQSSFVVNEDVSEQIIKHYAEAA